MKPKLIRKHDSRPPGGHVFESVQIANDGWLCLAPWIQTKDGYWWRPHIDGCQGHNQESKDWSEHMARSLNCAIGTRQEEPAQLSKKEEKYTTYVNGRRVMSEVQRLKARLDCMEEILQRSPSGLCLTESESSAVLAMLRGQDAPVADELVSLKLQWLYKENPEV